MNIRTDPVNPHHPFETPLTTTKSLCLVSLAEKTKHLSVLITSLPRKTLEQSPYQECLGRIRHMLPHDARSVRRDW
jgi:hypothetical protein